RDVALRAVRVDPRADGADEAEREIEERPLESRGGEDRERVPFPDAQREQAVGELVDRFGGFPPRDFAPVVAVLNQVGGALPLTLHGVLPQPRDRPRRCLPRRGVRQHSSLIVVREGSGAVRRNRLVPLNWRGGPMRTIWNGSISFGLVNIPV